MDKKDEQHYITAIYALVNLLGGYVELTPEDFHTPHNKRVIARQGKESGNLIFTIEDVIQPWKSQKKD